MSIEKIDHELCKKAISKLTDEGSVEESYIWIVVSLIKIPQTSSLKPHQIKLSHSIYSKAPSVCLFARDPHKSVKQSLEEIKVKALSKVIPVSKLKSKYSTYEAKRQLSSAFDLFLSDTRVVPILPKLIGKSFFLKNKYPVPIDLSSIDVESAKDSDLKKIKEKINELIQSSFLVFNNGPCVSLKIGNTKQSLQDIQENLNDSLKALENVIADGGFQNIRSIYLKTSKSASYPIYLTELSISS